VNQTDQAERIIDSLSASGLSGPELRQEAVAALSELDGYDWCGVYRLEGDRLELDRYVGEATDHTSIPVGVGVCGTAIAEGRDQVIHDVREIENYLSCSFRTRSEIVTLIWDETGRILGQIDVDGHRVGAFDESDREFLTRVGRVLAGKWGA
jgi:GAF domain-containing protein